MTTEERDYLRTIYGTLNRLAQNARFKGFRFAEQAIGDALQAIARLETTQRIRPGAKVSGPVRSTSTCQRRAPNWEQ